MKPWLTEHYGNPSSLYRMGREAKEAINEARKVVGKCLNAAMPVNEKNDYAPGEILFTGGGSQADNLAITRLYARSLRQGPQAYHHLQDRASCSALHLRSARKGRLPRSLI